MDPVQQVPAALNQGWGYGVVLGVGIAFAVFMYGITWLLKKYEGENNSHFETYAVAGRSIGTGLTATGVISSWAWPTALLSSCVVTYNYGVAGAYWFGAGCVVQISFFSLLAIQSKKRAPHAHTLLEIVKARYGKLAHQVYLFLALLNNTIATVNMFLGAAATIAALTGMSTYAATWLLPVGVCLYTITGGLRASFITDYFHTVILLVICVYLCLKIIVPDSTTGGLDNIYRIVSELAATTPVKGNIGGSYLTMGSVDALGFAGIHTIGNFGLVLLDTSYWAKAFSADITAATPGYLLGGVLYFGIPWALGTISGLAALSLTNNPAWPAFGRMLNADEINNGLVLPYASVAAAGEMGARLCLVVIFCAVTSTTSAQLVGVSSLIASDVYHTYINPKASDRSIINVSRAACVGFAVFTCAVSSVFFKIGLGLTWTLYFLGVIVCPGVATVVCTMLWDRQTKAAAIISPIVGMAAGLAVWISTAWHYGDGVLNVTTTGALYPCLWGNLTSFTVPFILTPAISLIWPQERFDWERFSDIKLISSDDSSSIDGNKDQEKRENAGGWSPAQLAYMGRMSRVSAWCAGILSLAVWGLWPFPMWNYDFSLAFFRGWIVVSLVWLFITLIVVTFMAPIEGRHVLARLARAVIGRTTTADIAARGSGRRDREGDAALEKARAGSISASENSAEAATRTASAEEVKAEKSQL